MFAFAHIIAEGAVHELAWRRHLLGGQPFRAQETIDWVGGLKHLKLACRVGPLVFFGGREQHRPWRAKGHQAILVERQPLRSVVELLELRVEPVRRKVVDGLYGFADLAAARRRAAAAGLVRKRDRDALVERRREESSLAVARVAERRDTVRVHSRLSDQVVHATMEA